VAVLVAAVAIVGVLCLLDLLLTFGVIRRLREHTEMITRISVPDVPVIGLAQGDSPAEVAASTTDGAVAGPMAALRLVAFFSTSCSICPERVAPFVEYVTEHQIAKENVLAVVVGPPDQPPAYLDRLAAAAQVSAEADNGALSTAFKVVGYPAFCLLSADGTVRATGYDPAMLPEPAAVR
jgi:hypothetical protein